MIKNFYYRIFEISKFKMFEIQFYLCKMYFDGLDLSINILKENSYFRFYLDLYLFKLDVDFSRRCDHHGISLNLSLLNLNFDFTKYDTRHWDDELNNYTVE